MVLLADNSLMGLMLFGFIVSLFLIAGIVIFIGKNIQKKQSMSGYDIAVDESKTRKGKKEKAKKEKREKVKKEKISKPKLANLNPISQSSNDTGFLPIPSRAIPQSDEDFSPDENSPFRLSNIGMDIVEPGEPKISMSPDLFDDFEIIPPKEVKKAKDEEQW